VFYEFLYTQLREMPWLRFVTSGPVWAIVIANFCMDWGGYTIMTCIPTFYKEVLVFDIESVSNRLCFASDCCYRTQVKFCV